jgi:murein L,D-transpeptidase YcbB/YkuD
LLDSLKTGFHEKGMTDVYSSFRQLEYLLTKAYIDYATGLKYGFLSPQKLFPEDYFIGTQSPDSAHYAGLFAAMEEACDYLDEVQPTDTLYLHLQGLLKQYQALPDSIVSDSIAYHYKTIQANLERYRWKRTTPASDKYIYVNVAAFNLLAVEPGSTPLMMNVCVGKGFTNQTPLLESEVYYMNLNPKWNVPASIIEKEVYWAVRKDSTYLQKQRMKILKGTEEIDPATIDWEKINPQHFPYLIVQDSGNANSLGRIKFMFNNPFSVYLHDTPLKKRFSHKDRAVSHGCVRVQKPMDLAYFCLSTKDSVFFDRLRATIELPPVSKEGKKLQKQAQLEPLKNDLVHLTTKVPLTIDYRTVYTLPDGQTYFAEDVYGFDEKIRKALLSAR